MAEVFDFEELDEVGMAFESVDEVLEEEKDSDWTGSLEKRSREILAGRSHKDITYWKPWQPPDWTSTRRARLGLFSFLRSCCRRSAARGVISIFCSVPSSFFRGLNVVTVAFRTTVFEKYLIESLDILFRLRTYDWKGAPKRGARKSKIGRGVF